VKLVDISGTKEGIPENNLKLTVGSKILGTYIGASVTLRRITRLELI